MRYACDRSVAVLVLVLGVGVVPGVASAQTDSATLQQMQQAGEGNDAQARSHFDVAQSLYRAGRFAEAATEFEEAYRLSNRAQLLFNVYVAQRDASNIAGAVSALERYLAAMPGDLPERLNLEARLAAMQQALAAQQAGQQAQMPVETPEEEQQEEQEMQQALPPPPPRPPDNTLSTVGWILTGVGGAAVIGGVITGVLTLGAADGLKAADRCGPMLVCPESERGALSSANGLAVATDVLLIVGGAIAVTGVVLGIVGQPSTAAEAPAVTATAFCTDTGCMAVMGGRL